MVKGRRRLKPLGSGLWGWGGGLGSIKDWEFGIWALWEPTPVPHLCQGSLAMLKC